MNAAETLKCFDTILDMLKMLNSVANDELECQGHALECSQMLCEVVQVTGTLFLKYKKYEEAMIKRLLPDLNFLGDDNGHPPNGE